MQYYAMIEGEQRGPYELGQLPEAGVRPGTYVWCKGMDSWEKAEDVADICRYYRQRIFDLTHPSRPQSPPPTPQDQEASDDPFESVPLRFRGLVRRSGEVPGPAQDPDWTDTSTPPVSTIILATFLTVFCFPITGVVAIYYSMMASKAWNEATRSQSKQQKALYSEQEREELREQAHDYSRSAKMWIGITFFMGLILYAFLGRTFL